MKNVRNGFAWVPLLLVIVGVSIAGGGAYYVLRPDTAPSTQQSDSNTSVKAPIDTDQNPQVPTKDSLIKIEIDLFKDAEGNVYTYGETDATNGTFTKAPGVDGTTFKYLGDSTPILYFSKGESLQTETYYADKNNVYKFVDYLGMGSSKGTLSLRAGVDLNSFKVLDDGYTKDKNAAYYVDTVIAGADAASFVYLSAGFAKDKNNVYVYGTPLSGADAKSFVGLDRYFAKDANHVYVSYNHDYQKYIVDGADSNTFIVRGRGYGKDANAVYNFTSGKIAGVDLDSFEVFESQNALGYGADAKDKNHEYEVGRIFNR